MTLSACMLALALLGALVAPTPARAQTQEAPLTVATINGPSEILRKGTQVWIPAKIRDKVADAEGARAMAGGRLVLLTASGNSLRLAQFTQILLPERPPGMLADAPLKVHLDGGRLWVSVLPMVTTRAPLEIEAGPVTVGPRAGGTVVRANPDGSITVRVYHGLAVARATKGGWDRTLQAGTQVQVPAGGDAPTPGPLLAEPEEANWVKWNTDQDRVGYGMPAPK